MVYYSVLFGSIHIISFTIQVKLISVYFREAAMYASAAWPHGESELNPGLESSALKTFQHKRKIFSATGIKIYLR